MEKMKTILIAVGLLICNALSAQTIKEIIDSPRTDKMIFVDTTQKIGKSIAKLDDVEGDEFIFSLIDEDRRGKTHIEIRKYEVWVESYNPLSYTFGNTVELVTDPNSKTIAGFLNSFSDGGVESDGDKELVQESIIIDSVYTKIDSFRRILKINPALYGDTILQLLIDLPFYERKSTEAELIKFKDG